MVFTCFERRIYGQDALLVATDPNTCLVALDYTGFTTDIKLYQVSEKCRYNITAI